MITSPAVCVMRVVAEHYGIQTAQLQGGDRVMKHVRPRWVAFWLCHEVCGMSFMEIGRKFDRDHTTVAHGVKRARDILANPIVRADVNRLAEIIRDECGLKESFAVLRTLPVRVTFTMTYPRPVNYGVSRETVAA